MAEEDLIDPELAKRTAQLLLEMFQDFHRRLLDQAGEMARWLLASLLAVNSGGLFALASFAEKMEDPRLPGILFLAGVLFSLGSGVAIQSHTHRAMKPVTEGIGGLLVFAVGEHYDGSIQDAEQFLKSKERAVKKWAWIAPACGWISATLFGIGGITTGLQLTHAPIQSVAARIANNGRCMALERDMLSERPKRDDGAVLYQTLGCKPQTLSPVHERHPSR